MPSQSTTLKRAAARPKPAKKALARKGHECYHCRQWVEAGEAHDCWTTTEAALTRDLPEDLRDAWERIRETAVEFGEQRIYASHKSIMFSRTVCYFFVRPAKKALEVWFFLGRTAKSPMIRKALSSSGVKVAHLVRITHRDEVEAPLTDWLKEAFAVSEDLRVLTRKKPRKKPSKGK
ncbi:MAG TPA: DUF5655 domain-containing protein [Terriglobia bacterium]|nr:DUF5655 domain-containing protein [Terriglobia bacterium]